MSIDRNNAHKLIDGGGAARAHDVVDNLCDVIDAIAKQVAAQSAQHELQLKRLRRQIGGAERSPMSQERFGLRIREAAEALGLGMTNTRKLVASGALPSVRIGKRIIITPESIRAFLAKAKAKPLARVLFDDVMGGDTVARCEACGRYFVAPRKTSRGCSDRCTGTLRQRQRRSGGDVKVILDAWKANKHISDRPKRIAATARDAGFGANTERVKTVLKQNGYSQTASKANYAITNISTQGIP